MLRLARPLLPFLLAGAMLAGLILSVNARAIADELGSVDLSWLPLIIAANLASDWFRGVRWQHLLSPIGRPGVFLLFAASQVGSTVNLLIPLRAGEAVRVQIVSQRSGIGAASLVATLLSEVVSDLFTFSAYIVIGLLLLEQASFLWPLAVVSAALAVGGLAGAFWLARHVERVPDPSLSPPSGRIRAWLQRELYNFAQGLQAFRDPGVMLNVAWSAQAIWLCEALTFYACGRALDVDLPAGGYLLLVVAVNVSGAVPLTVAGVGVFEVTLVGLMAALGVDATKAAAYAIFVHLLLTAPHIVSGPLAAAALRLRPSEALFMGGRAKGEE